MASPGSTKVTRFAGKHPSELVPGERGEVRLGGGLEVHRPAQDLAIGHLDGVETGARGGGASHLESAGHRLRGHVQGHPLRSGADQVGARGHRGQVHHPLNRLAHHHPVLGSLAEERVQALVDQREEGGVGGEIVPLSVQRGAEQQFAVPLHQGGETGRELGQGTDAFLVLDLHDPPERGPGDRPADLGLEPGEGVVTGGAGNQAVARAGGLVGAQQVPQGDPGEERGEERLVVIAEVHPVPEGDEERPSRPVPLTEPHQGLARDVGDVVEDDQPDVAESHREKLIGGDALHVETPFIGSGAEGQAQVGRGLGRRLHQERRHPAAPQGGDITRVVVGKAVLGEAGPEFLPFGGHPGERHVHALAGFGAEAHHRLPQHLPRSRFDRDRESVHRGLTVSRGLDVHALVHGASHQLGVLQGGVGEGALVHRHQEHPGLGVEVGEKVRLSQLDPLSQAGPLEIGDDEEFLVERGGVGESRSRAVHGAAQIGGAEAGLPPAKGFGGGVWSGVGFHLVPPGVHPEEEDLVLGLHGPQRLTGPGQSLLPQGPPFPLGPHAVGLVEHHGHRALPPALAESEVAPEGGAPQGQGEERQGQDPKRQDDPLGEPDPPHPAAGDLLQELEGGKGDPGHLAAAEQVDEDGKRGRGRSGQERGVQERKRHGQSLAQG